jgi:hypothetical protein
LLGLGVFLVAGSYMIVSLGVADGQLCVMASGVIVVIWWYLFFELLLYGNFCLGGLWLCGVAEGVGYIAFSLHGEVRYVIVRMWL